MNTSILTASLCAALLCGAATANADTPAATAATATTAMTAGTPATPTRDPVPPPNETPEIKQLLKSMSYASTWGHPDLFGEFAGMQRLFDGDYKGALKYFKIGAYYADKMSQLSIGMMYLNGRGVKQDWPTACAWLGLAAERKYQKFVKARNQVCDALTPAQRSEAAAVLQKLLPEYGDKVAMKRMKLALAEARTELTGSHVGYNFGVSMAPALNSIDAMAKVSRCANPPIHLGGLQVPMSGCGIYDPELWNSKNYFAARNAQWDGVVTVGPLQGVNTPASSAGAKQVTGKKTPPASASSPSH